MPIEIDYEPHLKALEHAIKGKPGGLLSDHYSRPYRVGPIRSSKPDDRLVKAGTQKALTKRLNEIMQLAAKRGHIVNLVGGFPPMYKYTKTLQLAGMKWRMYVDFLNENVERIEKKKPLVWTRPRWMKETTVMVLSVAEMKRMAKVDLKGAIKKPIKFKVAKGVIFHASF